MTDLDTVLVKPTTDYFEGFEHKSPASEPYAVSRGTGLELQALGFAKIVEPAPEPAPAAEAPPAVPMPPKRRGRPSRAR